MSRYYQLKTTRPLPETYIPMRVTQIRPFFACKILPNGTVLPTGERLPPRIDECMAWRVDDDHASDKGVICADTESVYGDETTIIDPMHPEETTVVELDLEDPVVALQLLLRYREVFADGSDFVRQVDILTSLIATDEAGKARRRMFLYNLLLELDVPASPAKETV